MFEWPFLISGVMKSVREIIVARYSKLGSKYKAERVAEAIDRDLLGVEGLHGIN